MTKKTKRQLETELFIAKEKLSQAKRRIDEVQGNNYYAAKYLQILRAINANMMPLDFDRVLTTLGQDKYID